MNCFLFTTKVYKTKNLLGTEPIIYYTTLYYTTLHYTTLHHTTLYYTTLRYTTLYYTTTTVTRGSKISSLPPGIKINLNTEINITIHTDIHLAIL